MELLENLLAIDANEMESNVYSEAQIEEDDEYEGQGLYQISIPRPEVFWTALQSTP